MKKYVIDQIIKTALIEDMPYGDITTENVIGTTFSSEGIFIAKQDGVIAGVEVARRVFYLIDPSINFEVLITDGSKVNNGDTIAKISGNTRNILMGERVALNFMQRMSGIAALTNKFVEEVKDYSCRIVDTRKTTPTLRVLEKEAVRLGGGKNHRFNLSDAVMLKDNHIAAVGSIKESIKRVRKSVPHTTKIEIEVETLDQLVEALKYDADIIMLDNMKIEDMRKAVLINNGQAILEASGNMSLDRVKDVAKTGIDVISVGALTHSYTSLDISLNFIK